MMDLNYCFTIDESFIKTGKTNKKNENEEKQNKQ